ncbi:MAG: hypothetical protein WA708_01870 [Acidobacteriaceae bacterium]
MHSVAATHRTPADSSISGHFSNPQITGREFLERAETTAHLLRAYRSSHGEDAPAPEYLEYLVTEKLVQDLKDKYPSPLPRRVTCQALPARFRREPDLWLGNIRFGRTRLFLSHFIGDLAWRGWRTM